MSDPVPAGLRAERMRRPAPPEASALRPHGEPSAPAGWRAWHELRDPFALGSAALWLACCLLVSWRPFETATDKLFASELAFALLAAAAAAGAVARFVPERGRSARWTYGALAVSFLLWVAVEALEFAHRGRSFSGSLELATDLVYLLTYGLLLLAAETAVAGTSSGRGTFHVQLELLATILVVGVILCYFLLLPYNLDGVNRLRSVSWWSYYALFDLLLLVRVAMLHRRAPPGPRRRLVGWLGGVAALLFAADLAEAVWHAGGGSGLSPSAFFQLYYTALLCGAFAGRVALDRARSTGEVALGTAQGLALPRFSPVLAFVVALPLGHLLLESVAPAPPSYRGARDALVIGTTGILGLLAAWSWTSFRREHLRLVQASERTSEALARSRHLEAIGRLAAGVAHDFNNRLTVILGYASRLRGRSGDDAAREQAVSAIAEAADQASRLTMELLAVGRAQAARAEPLDLARLAGDLASEARQLAAPGIEVTLRLEARSLPIEVDRMHLLRIVWNLAANASDAMPDGGPVDLIVGARDVGVVRDSAGEIVPPGRYALLAVADRGVGMSEEMVAQLFDPFFTTKEFGRGSGLGLAAVLGLIRSNGGFVLVESAPGEGSRFEVLFPLRA